MILLLLLFLFSLLFVLLFRLLRPLIATKEQKVLTNKTIVLFQTFEIYPDLDVVTDINGVAHSWIPQEVGLGGVRF